MLQPVLRQNPLTGQWVIFAPGRALRPVDFIAKNINQRNEQVPCPFCLGHEQDTPPEVAVIRSKHTKPNTPGWSMRVVPNRYPALVCSSVSKREKKEKPDFEKETVSSGIHEVVIFSPSHTKSLHDLNHHEGLQLFTLLQKRIKKSSQCKKIKYIQVIGNMGKEAGASLSHPHLQIFSLDFIPNFFLSELTIARKYYHQKHQCLLCSIIATLPKERIVCQDKEVVCFAPFAPATPFELWFAPRQHSSSFEQAPPQIVECLFHHLSSVLKKTACKLNAPPYHLYVRTLPVFQIAQKKLFHWYVVVKPCSERPAGFEISTGIFINSVLPEEAVHVLNSR